MNKKVEEWWDKLGKPQYGGELVIRANRNLENFDPYFDESNLCSIQGAWMERLVCDDWTVGPATWNFGLGWHPAQYKKGQLAESWEFTDSHTHVVHLRKGVHWQKIPPADGREFTAEDVVFHFKRLYGPDGDFSKPSPAHVDVNSFPDLISVTAADRYTVVFKFKTANTESIMWTLYNFSLSQCMENSEAVRKWGDVGDWHHAIGTGPFILQDFVPGKSADLIRNPDYWGHDERYPQNGLPYLDKVRYLIIPDEDAALELMRAGKIDVMYVGSPVKAQAMLKTNPDLQLIPAGVAPPPSLQMSMNEGRFSDIRIRKAMQVAIDLPAIAKSYYKGLVAPYPATVTSRLMKGWGFPYEDWPQDLKDEYAYNPPAAKQLLTDAGYPDGMKASVVANSSADLNMLQIIKSYFLNVGIDLQIRTIAPDAWNTFMEKERNADQLLYHAYGPFGHSFEPQKQVGRFRADPITNALFLKASAMPGEAELRQLLRDANERAARQHFAISILEPQGYALCQPWFKGFSGQIHSVWMNGGGPCMASFYLGRFWIDRQLKQSMGY
jgi:peptide/nickel transport system substrate-binding protein